MGDEPEKKMLKRICAGLLAHVDAGKTTLSEALLYESGQLRRLGRVDHRDAFLDTDAQERERGITIFSKQARLSLDGLDLTLLDTPGHVDFSSEMERTLQVLDYAILVISGTDGVQGHTATLWRLLARYHIPTFLFVNKMDLAGSDRDALLAQLQVYSDGTTLADHISPELYARVQAAAVSLGMEPNGFDAYKPWALASTFGVLSLQDDTTGTNAMAIDMYINAYAVNAGKTIDSVETYAFQGGIFDGLSAEYQEAYLDASLAGYEGMLKGEAADEAVQALAQAQQEQIAAMFDAWKDRDPDALAEVYDKEAILNSDDELNSKLFTERDPGMIAAAAEYLETEGENTFFLAVGAGHMVDPGGIVSGLKELGYTVELVP